MLDNHSTGHYKVLNTLSKGNVKINYVGKPTVIYIYRLERLYQETRSGLEG